MTDAEIIADMFVAPCDYNIDLDLNDVCDCENECGSEQTPAICWQRYFDLKRDNNK
jgi:hypothetical protein